MRGLAQICGERGGGTYVIVAQARVEAAGGEEEGRELEDATERKEGGVGLGYDD